VRLRSQIVILETGRGHHRKYLPFAFTENGALMAATLLNSPQAVKMSRFDDFVPYLVKGKPTRS
jgi:hypothetical protein